MLITAIPCIPGIHFDVSSERASESPAAPPVYQLSVPPKRGTGGCIRKNAPARGGIACVVRLLAGTPDYFPASTTRGTIIGRRRSEVATQRPVVRRTIWLSAWVSRVPLDSASFSA